MVGKTRDKGRTADSSYAGCLPSHTLKRRMATDLSGFGLEPRLRVRIGVRIRVRVRVRDRVRVRVSVRVRVRVGVRRLGFGFGLD